MILMWGRRNKKNISEGSHSAGKNEFVSQFTCLQPDLHVKIHAPHNHISTRKWQHWTTFSLVVALT